MQVKKFEARTMKDALEMVKSQLGPDAIILSARDNNKSFGLVGEGSVEITAAVSEETLQRKKFAESRLRGQDLDTFLRSPARVQKNIIEKMVNKQVERQQQKPITSRRYIDIADESAAQNAGPAPVPAITPEAVAAVMAKRPATAPAATAPAAAAAIQSAAIQKANDGEISALKGEIATLRELLAKFKDIPQTVTGSHPGADYGIPYDLAFMFEKLTGTGIAPEIAADVLVKAQENIPALKLKNRNLVEVWVARHLLETSHVTPDGFAAKVQVFAGPAGGGKTTAMVKMASHLVVNEGRKVALLTTDTFKVGAADQMRMYAQILNVPFAIIRNAADWANIMRYLANIDVVLIDMPGFGLKTPDEIEQVRALMPPAMLNPRVHLVMSATDKDSDVTEVAGRYSVLGFDDAIFTGLDASLQHGTIYNFIQRFGAPLHSFGIGPRVPEDFEPATAERVLDLLFKITRNPQPSAEA